MSFVPSIFTALSAAFAGNGLAVAAGTAAAGATTAALTAKGAEKILTPKLTPKQLPAVPQIDEAAMAIQQSDRLRRRRGAAANIYAGGNAAAPAVGKQTLGG